MRLLLPSFLIGVTMFASCTNDKSSQVSDSLYQVNLKAGDSHTVSGTLTVAPSDAGIVITGLIRELHPGVYAIHFHENGDCSARDFSSAGGHFNPVGSPHGAPGAGHSDRHVGDIGNINVANDDEISVLITDSMAQLSGANSVVGRAVVIHAGEDDYISQPSGNAGPRIACGVVEPK